MTAPELHLSGGEGRELRRLLVPDAEGEVRLLVLVRGDRAVHAVRTDLGPLAECPPDLHRNGLAGARVPAGSPWVDRLVTIDAGAEPTPSSTLAGLFQGTIRSDPPWVPVVDRIRRLPAIARRALSRLLPDGVYGLALTDAGVALSARVRAGRVELVKGTSSLGPQESAETSTLVTLLRRRVGPPQLVLALPERVARQILASRRPATELDRAVIRGDARVCASSLRARLCLLALRLLGA